ncbi:MAG: YggS family pyridoxal phosphate-dependent enzyme [Elusimicrobiota bacterium]
MKRNVKKILSEIPEHVKLEAACKTRTAAEIQKAVDGGIRILGENYYQEAADVVDKVTGKPQWHFIGHLQRNKVKKAIKIFDMIESLDSYRLAKEINKRCKKIDKVMDCLVEVNSGREKNKYGIFPEEIEDFIDEVKDFKYIKIKGLMTMGAFEGTSEDFRPYFKITRKIFNSLKLQDIPECDMEYLSMGMSTSYKIAIEEGANIVRIGTKIFGPRS